MTRKDQAKLHWQISNFLGTSSGPGGIYQDIEEYMAITTKRPITRPGSHQTSDTKTLSKK